MARLGGGEPAAGIVGIGHGRDHLTHSVSGWFCMPDSSQQAVGDEQVPLVDRAPGAGGKAGQTMTLCAPSASASASATGPMLPSGVESKVEQYLNRIWRAALRAQPVERGERLGAIGLGPRGDEAGSLEGDDAPPRRPRRRRGPSGMPQYCTTRIAALPALLWRDRSIR